MKYFLIVLTITILSCSGRTTDSSAQAPEAPNAPAASEAPAAPSAQTAPVAPNADNAQTAPAAPSAPTANQQAQITQAAGAPQVPVAGIHWKLIELNGKNVEGKTAREMYLFLDPSSPIFKSHSGCNLVTGEAKRGGTNQMWFINLIPTSGDCKTPDIDLEFQKALAETAFYKVTGKTLVLSKKGQVPVMTFVAKG
ncbi:MAG: META domain-containing protein [Saprospiraceae bacterium]|nr:META domain-containing protein [Candidatus Opimibacter iunctus]